MNIGIDLSVSRRPPAQNLLIVCPFTMNSQPEPADYVLRNHLLVGKIMTFYEVKNSFDTRFLVNLRLLNKTISSIILQRFRREHVNVKVCAHYVISDGLWDLPKVRLTRSMGMFPVRGGYFDFLNQVVKVKIYNFTIGYIRIKGEDKEILHEQLHRLLFKNRDYMKTFFGMKQLCEHGCDDCEYIVDRCQEYGPLQLRVLLSDTKRHFKKCVNFDHDIASLAINISKCSESPEECLQMTEQMFDSNVSCDNLVLNLFENRYILNHQQPSSRTNLLPWELVQTILKNWEVKNIELNLFRVDYHHSETSWQDVGYFTGFNWKFPLENRPQLVSNVRLQNVRIDLEKALFLQYHIFLRISRNDRITVNNFFSSVRRIHPSERYQIVMNRGKDQFYGRIQWDFAEVIHKTYQLIWKDEPTNLNLDIALFSMSLVEDLVVETVHEGRQLTVTRNEWSERVAQFSPGCPFESFNPNKWTGYSIRVADPKTNC